MVSLEDVRRVGRDQWPSLRVADVMTPIERLHTVAPSKSASAALALLAERGLNQLPVVEGRQVLGLVTREDILKWLVLGAGAAKREGG
jgi:CBS domain-containing protein